MRYGFCAATATLTKPTLPARRVPPPLRRPPVAPRRAPLARPAGRDRAPTGAVPMPTVATRADLAPGATPPARERPMALRNRNLPPPGAGPAGGSAAILPSSERPSPFGPGGSPVDVPTTSGRASASFSRRLADLVALPRRSSTSDAGGTHPCRRRQEPDPPATPSSENHIQRQTAGYTRKPTAVDTVLRRICTGAGRRGSPGGWPRRPGSAWGPMGSGRRTSTVTSTMSPGRYAWRTSWSRRSTAGAWLH